MQVSVATAHELDILNYIIVVQYHVDQFRTGTLGYVVYLFHNSIVYRLKKFFNFENSDCRFSSFGLQLGLSDNCWIALRSRSDRFSGT